MNEIPLVKLSSVHSFPSRKANRGHNLLEMLLATVIFATAMI